MTNNQRLAELLQEWRKRLESGEHLTPEELCKEDPEYIELVREQMADIATVARFPGGGTSAGSRADREHSTIEITGDRTGANPKVPATKPATAPSPPAFPGYRITSEIARGGMGCVYAGIDLTLGREVAIKTLLPHANVDRFVAESKITARLPHPNIPPVHALGTLSDGSPYLVMKLIRGQTLEDMLRDRESANKERRLEDWPRWAQVFESIAQAVGFAHARGIIHRDLKPANVMVGEFGEVQVMDWGLARDTSASVDTSDHSKGNSSPAPVYTNLTAAGDVMGTPGYMAPEQARGEPATPASDVFALGGILCAILTGSPVFSGTSAADSIRLAATGDTDDALSRLQASGADAEVVALAKRCLAVNANDRPADGRAVAAEMAAYRAGVESRLRKSETERATARVRNLATIAVAVVLLAGLGVSLWQMARAISAEGKAVSAGQAKDVALSAEKKARTQAFKALRSMTDDIVEQKFDAGKGNKLSDDDRKFLQGVIDQYEAFAAITEDDVSSREMRAEGRFRIGGMRARMGEVKEAEADYDAAIGIYEQLVAEFPARADFRYMLARILVNRGDLLSDTGRVQQGEDDFEAALSIRKRLVADFPTDPDYRRDLAQSHNRRGVLFSDTGRLPAAEAEYDAALAAYQQLAAEFPLREEFRQDVARCHLNRGVVRIDLDRIEEAEADYDAALVVYKQLAADFPTRPQLREELAQIYHNRGILLADSDRQDEAEASYSASLALRRQLAADFPAQPIYRQDLARSHHIRGILFRDTDRMTEAETEFDAAIAIQKQLVADFPSQTLYRQVLARSNSNQGILLSMTSRLTEAEQHFKTSLGLYLQLITEVPRHQDIRNELAGNYVNLAIVLRKQRKFTEAKQLLLEGRPHHLAALQANPVNPACRRFYQNNLSFLTKVQAELLEPEAAIRTAETIRDLGWDAPSDAYNAACELSLCIPIVREHAELDETQREDAARLYGDEAMKLLRKAVSKGWNDAAHMKEDTDLDPLREREDFQKLLSDLEAAAKRDAAK